MFQKLYGFCIDFEIKLVARVVNMTIDIELNGIKIAAITG